MGCLGRPGGAGGVAVCSTVHWCTGGGGVAGRAGLRGSQQAGGVRQAALLPSLDPQQDPEVRLLHYSCIIKYLRVTIHYHYLSCLTLGCLKNNEFMYFRKLRTV